MPKFIGLILLLPLISGCKQLTFQDLAINDARNPTEESTLSLQKDLKLDFQRGVMEDKFVAILDKGEYKSIIESPYGTFYLAPKGKFSYKNNSRLKSTVGGIFLRNVNSKPYVWFAPQKNWQTQWEIWASGENIDDVLPGPAHIKNKPFIERDFNIPEKIFAITNNNINLEERYIID